jgi:hypothetical protein
MPVAIMIVNIVFIVGVLGVIVGLCTWAVVTQHRDHGVIAEGSLFRRRIWSRGSVRARTWSARASRPAAVRADRVTRLPEAS